MDTFEGGRSIWRGDKLKKYRSDWAKGKLPQVCIECTRYEPVDEYIKAHKSDLAIAYAKRRTKQAISILGR